MARQQVFHLHRSHDEEKKPDDSQQEHQRVVAHVAGLEEAEKVAAGRVSAWVALRHPLVLRLIAAYFLVVMGNQALVFFLPSIVDAMHGMPVAARTAVAALPYVCSMAGILLNGFLVERTHAPVWHTTVPMLATGVWLGLVILAGSHLAMVIVLLCLAGFTSQAYLPVLWTLPSTLLGKSAKATAVGLISLGNIGGFVGPYLFGYLRTATGAYAAGLWVLAACMLLAGAITLTTAASSASPTSRQT